MNIKNRIEQFRYELKKNKADAYYISDMSNIAYLTGFTGSAAKLIISTDSQHFFTDGRYEKQSLIELDQSLFEIKIVSQYSFVIKDELQKYRSLMIEPQFDITSYQQIKEFNSALNIIHDKVDIILNQRMVKDQGEIKDLDDQYRIAGTAFLSSLSSFKADVSERSWAAKLSYEMMMSGAEGESFDTIVASGKRGAMPHGVASDKIVESSDPVIVDFGSRVAYNSDYTRMIYSGSDSEILKVIDIVRTAMLKAIDFCRVGVKASDIDKVARDYISSHGYGKYFNHSLGHGVGLNIHELPTLNTRTDITISNGMIFTIEPGIYLADKFGVRIEETVCISNGSIKLLSSYLDKHIYALA